MSSTLPRTRSVSAASSSSSSGASGTKDRVRPVSVCDTSWARMMSQEHHRPQPQLVRTPSQANSLCTTVPQNLIVQNLGGRHTPTRSSLRHSRMIVLAKNGQPIRARRWAPHSLGRVGVLVVTAQILVGVMGVTLAAWFLMWAPMLRFREVPHYAGVPVFLTGAFGAVLISCFQRRRHRNIANVVKGVLAALCCISVVTCLCVSIFTALHLSQLFSMSCHTLRASVRPPPRDRGAEGALPKPVSRLAGIEDDEDEAFGGSGDGANDEAPEFEAVAPAPASASASDGGNATSCECERRGATWVRTRTYPDLSCRSVRNVLPVLFVASCVVAAVGAVLSALTLYLLWHFKNGFYAPAKPHETRPFVFSSNFDKGEAKASSNGSGSRVSNGDSRFR